MTQRGVALDVHGRAPLPYIPASQKRSNKLKISIFDWIPAILIVVCCANILLNYEAIAAREGSAIPSDIYLGVI